MLVVLSERFLSQLNDGVWVVDGARLARLGDLSTQFRSLVAERLELLSPASESSEFQGGVIDTRLRCCVARALRCERAMKLVAVEGSGACRAGGIVGLEEV